jgi:hypothetical protein
MPGSPAHAIVALRSSAGAPRAYSEFWTAVPSKAGAADDPRISAGNRVIDGATVLPRERFRHPSSTILE